MEFTGFFKYFKELSNVPRVSHHTKAASEFLVNFAVSHNLRYATDEPGNVIIYKPASPGYEEHSTVILQGHIDMVGAATDDCTHDFLTDGITVLCNEEEGYLYADNTTLGADNGIAVAYILEILSDDRYRHPAIEAVFTVDEEVGLLGATALDCSGLSGRYMINLDSEDEGVFVMGCAGGLRSDLRLSLPCTDTVGTGIRIVIDSLLGGHSGEMIGTGRPSANVLMGRALKSLSENCRFGLVSLYGGEVDNAICSSAEAVIVTDAEPDELASILSVVNKAFLSEYAGIDDNISVKADVIGEGTYSCVSDIGLEKILFMLNNLPYGVQLRNPQNTVLVTTSLNPGIMRLTDGEFKLGYSVRSSVKEAKRALADRLCYFAEFMGGTCEESGDYPSWPYNPDSALKEIAMDTYRTVFGKEAGFSVIHAGLECGIFADKMPGLDIISYGPKMKDIHTPKERLYIDSAQRVFDFTIKLLERL